VAGSRLASGKAPWRAPRPVHPSPAALRCRSKFLRFFPQGFEDPVYLDWERGYKWAAHEQWDSALGGGALARMLAREQYADIAALAVRIDSRTNLLSSFEKTALRDAIRTPDAARVFAIGLHDFLSSEPDEASFTRWTEAVASLPRKQTRVLTWPVVTIFGFIARPDIHIFLKPNVTRAGARQYGFDLTYAPHPSWDTYAGLLELTSMIARDLRDLSPEDMIDIQSFIRVQGSDEYEE
jgi:hypothetical protein